MGSDLTILIAEDSADDAFLLQRVLRKIGVTNPFQIVSDGQNALDYLQGVGEYGDRTKYPFPSILVTDLKMPLRSGFEVLQWLQEHPECRVIPVIVLTSSSEEEDINRAYKLGANAYLVKPSSTKALEELMRVTVEFWCRCKKPCVPSKC